jgi:hypothetical protein
MIDHKRKFILKNMKEYERRNFYNEGFYSYD